MFRTKKSSAGHLVGRKLDPFSLSSETANSQPQKKHSSTVFAAYLSFCTKNVNKILKTKILKKRKKCSNKLKMKKKIKHDFNSCKHEKMKTFCERWN